MATLSKGKYEGEEDDADPPINTIEGTRKKGSGTDKQTNGDVDFLQRHGKSITRDKSCGDCVNENE